MEPVRFFTFHAIGKDYLHVYADAGTGTASISAEVTPDLKAQLRTLVEGWNTDEQAEAAS